MSWVRTRRKYDSRLISLAFVNMTRDQHHLCSFFGKRCAALRRILEFAPVTIKAFSASSFTFHPAFDDRHRYQELTLPISSVTMGPKAQSKAQGSSGQDAAKKI